MTERAVTNSACVIALERIGLLDALSYSADHETEIQQHIDQNFVPDDVVHPLTRPDA